MVAELVKAGHEVTVLHRHPKHDLGKKIGNLQADRNDPESLKSALAGRMFEVVFDNAYDWEHGTSASQIEATAKLVSGRLQRYVFMSSVAAYGDGLNHHEGDALAPDDHPDNYVRNKAMSERILFRMHQRNGFPIVTLRPPFIYGPANPYYREAFFWDRLRADRPIIIPGDGNRLMQFVYINDLVDACFNALEKHTAPGRAFNVGDDKALTQIEAVTEIAKSIGKVPNIVRVPREIIVRNGGNAYNEPFYFGQYLDVPPITEVIGRVKRVLNVAPTPFGTGLKETYKWYLRHAEPTKTLSFAFEDKVIRQAREYVQQRTAL